MDHTFKPGNRIKLTERVASRLSKQRNWFDRRGTVLATTKTSGQVVVKWDDRKSRDFWPARALEVVPNSERS